MRGVRLGMTAPATSRGPQPCRLRRSQVKAELSISSASRYSRATTRPLAEHAADVQARA